MMNGTARQAPAGKNFRVHKIDPTLCGTRFLALYKIETTKPSVVHRKLQTAPAKQCNASKKHTSSDKRPEKREENYNR